MKSAIKLLGIITLAAMMGFAMTACSSDDGDASGQLTITNFSGKLEPGKFVCGSGVIDGTDVEFLASFTPYKGAAVPSSGNIVLNAYKLDGSLFTGSVTAAIGDLTVGLFEDVDLEDVIQEYHNTVAITFTNGSATIDLNAQFE